jgi:hypothetical protein
MYALPDPSQSPPSSSLAILDMSQTSPTTGEAALPSTASSHVVRRKWRTSKPTPIVCVTGASIPTRSAQRNSPPPTMRPITSATSTWTPKPPLLGSNPWLRLRTRTAHSQLLSPSVGQAPLRTTPLSAPQRRPAL